MHIHFHFAPLYYLIRFLKGGLICNQMSGRGVFKLTLVQQFLILFKKYIFINRVISCLKKSLLINSLLVVMSKSLFQSYTISAMVYVGSIQ
jgi:hypothetical protein